MKPTLRHILALIICTALAAACQDDAPQTTSDDTGNTTTEDTGTTAEDTSETTSEDATTAEDGTETTPPEDATGGDATEPPEDVTVEDVPVGPAVTYHRDIKPIMEGLCQRCHSEGGIAPFTLLSYQDAYEARRQIRNAVVGRVMPPWPANDACEEYKYDWSLTDEQIIDIANWVDDGAPEGDPNDTPTPFEVEPPSGLSRVDLTLTMPEPYEPTLAPDDYRCIPIDWPETEDTYVTGMDIHPGNDTIVHHVIVYLVSPEYAGRVDNRDANEAGPGYTCFGTPRVPLNVTEGGPSLSALAFWAPGMGGVDFPEGTGLKVRPGSKVVVQVHYNLKDGATGQTDQTSFDFKLESSVQNEGMMLPVLDFEWPDSQKMHIPAGQAEVTHEGGFPLGAALSSFGMPDTFDLHMVGMHMHLLGKEATLSITPFGGRPSCLLEIPRWDFQWQFTFWLQQPIRVNPLDDLRVSCTWDNSLANQPVVDGSPLPPIDTYWGDGTRDEMCLGLLYVSFP